MSARIDLPACEPCVANALITKPLLLAINNSTSSTRTSFSFWGTITIREGSTTVYSSSITGCEGPILKNQIKEYSFDGISTTSTPTIDADGAGGVGISNGTITFKCGQTLDLSGLFLAWTDASPKSTCPLTSALIAPKCGTLDFIPIATGLSVTSEPTNVSCSGAADGAIDAFVAGGSGSYTYAWVASNGGVIPSGQADDQDLTLLVPGTYTLTVTDAGAGCTASTSETITQPNALAAPVVTLLEPTLCTRATGTVTVTNPVIANATYTLTQPNLPTSPTNPTSITTTTTTETVAFANLAAGGGFSITVTVNGCTSPATNCGNTTHNARQTPGPTTSSGGIALKKNILTEAYPNPTGRDATINFSVPKSGRVVVQVYNSLGARVATLFDDEVKAGENRSVILKGASLPSGNYTYRVIANGSTKSNRISLIK